MRDFIVQRENKGHKIVLLLDMNKDTYQIKKNRLTFGKLSEQEQLYLALFTVEGYLMPSHTGGTKFIDHISLHGIEPNNIVGAGQLPHKMVFLESDHQGVYADINYKSEMKMTVKELLERAGCQLASENGK